MRVFILKPDAIGDFILSTGCIRLIARELGERNLVIAVRADVAPLAKNQFPEAEVIPLPLREKRRILNVATVNVINCLPAWIRLLTFRPDASVCFRSMRAYLHTITFYLPHTQRRIACENLLLTHPRVRRPAVEKFAARFFKPTLIPYPKMGALPTDIEANRLVTCELLQRQISASEIFPTLLPPRKVNVQNRWLLCPFSSSIFRDYPAESWAEALILLLRHYPDAAIHLAAGPSQADRLQDFARTLETADLKNITIDPPLLLPDFIQTIAEARLVLTVDTGTAHMACALGSPAVIVCSGNQTGVWVPYSKNGLQKWLTPPDNLPKGEWRKYFTPEKIAASARHVLSTGGENFLG